jgi:hypothetical protein
MSKTPKFKGVAVSLEDRDEKAVPIYRHTSESPTGWPGFSYSRRAPKSKFLSLKANFYHSSTQASYDSVVFDMLIDIGVRLQIPSWVPNANGATRKAIPCRSFVRLAPSDELCRYRYRR